MFKQQNFHRLIESCLLQRLQVTWKKLLTHNEITWTCIISIFYLSQHETLRYFHLTRLQSVNVFN